MSEMRDRLTAALANHLEPIVAEAVANAGEGSGPYPQDWMDAVGILLAIVREPTDAMVEAGCESVTGYARPTAIRTAYTAMIDAVYAPCDSDGPRMAETNEDSARGEAGPARAEGIAQTEAEG